MNLSATAQTLANPQKTVRHLWNTAFCFLLLVPSSCQAGNHYCPVGYTLEVDLTRLSYQDERLIPRLADRVNSSSSFQCSWVLKVPRLTGPRQLVLQGIPGLTHQLRKISEASETTDDSGLLQYELHRPDKGDCIAPVQEPVRSGMYMVRQVMNSQTYLSVKFTRRSLESHGSHPVILRALLPIPGFCSRDMLSFHDNCYAVSPVPANITVAMSNIRGHAQLASFISMAEINEFIAANNARLEVHPYRRPLDLSQAVRLGMFYSAADATILRVVRNESGCSELRPLETPQEFRQPHPNGTCGSLSVDESGRAVLEFLDCSRPMASLLSFSESANEIRECVHCDNELTSNFTETLKLMHFSAVAFTWWIPLASVVPPLGCVLIVACAVLLAKYRGRRVFESCAASRTQWPRIESASQAQVANVFKLELTEADQHFEVTSLL